jgi:tetratricopeptide (TPR) repeat protein
MASDHAGAIRTCQRILQQTPLLCQQRADALHTMGLAYNMLQDFRSAYIALSLALELTPDDSHLWYNRGLACRFTMRSGQSLRDFERAAELEGGGEMAKDFRKQVGFSRKMVQRELTLRGPGFTLEQLIEQQELFQQASDAQAARAWARSEETFRRVIAMSDCLPQPWCNLGVCLIMQRRYDEAEAALKRALEIDPEYEIARHNLAGLPEIRRTDDPQPGIIVSPFDERKLKVSIRFQ